MVAQTNNDNHMLITCDVINMYRNVSIAVTSTYASISKEWTGSTWIFFAREERSLQEKEEENLRLIAANGMTVKKHIYIQ